MAALVRPTEGRMIGGVCAGLARRFGTSASTMRVIYPDQPHAVVDAPRAQPRLRDGEPAALLTDQVR
ncbi:PspC domain-containing protein, partial [Streptomyces cyaneofuscatus]|uniref:PspC domain-containing protein n=1 Tax=Streptomyces cyaneofuscatus TaxID=66883 RepID=UPI003F4E06CD